MATPSIGELLARLEEQQARIERLESQSMALPASPAWRKDVSAPRLNRVALPDAPVHEPVEPGRPMAPPKPAQARRPAG
jgi:hypothetical protein